MKKFLTLCLLVFILSGFMSGPVHAEDEIPRPTNIQPDKL